MTKLATITATLMALTAGHAMAQAGFNYDFVAESMKVQQIYNNENNTFGEQVNRHNGTLSFRQHDVVIKGNGPTIELARTFDTYSQASHDWFHLGAFLDWDLDIPRITASIPVNGSPSTSWSPAGFGVNRCNGYGTPVDGWKHDAVLYDGKGGAHPILIRSPLNTAPSSTAAVAGNAVSSRLVTKGGWALGCLSSAKNGTGQAFFAISPQGDKYWFDWFVRGRSQTWGVGFPSAADTSLLVTRIEDRHGNSITYSYTGESLTSIQASDGRSVSIEWNPAVGQYSKPYINKIKVNPGISGSTMEFSYNYVLANRYRTDGTLDANYSSQNLRAGHLRSLTLPDQSSWKFHLEKLSHTCYFEPEYPFCASDTPNVTTATGRIIAPSGVESEYVVNNTYFERFGAPTPTQDQWQLLTFDRHQLEVPQLAMKRRHGVGVEQVWTYSFEGESNGVFGPTRVHKEIRPDGGVAKYLVNNEWRAALEGKVLREEIYSASGSRIQVSNYTYATSDHGGFPTKIGTLPAGYLNTSASEHHLPLRVVSTIRQSTSFNWEALIFDHFARPISISKWSAPATE